MAEDGGALALKDVLDKLQRKYEAEKLAALESQKKDYEKQFQRMATAGGNEFDENDGGDVLNWLANTETDRTDQFRRSLEALHESLIKALSMVREANHLSEELLQFIHYDVALQIPSTNLSPNSLNGNFMTEPTVVVSKKGEGRQNWSMEKMFARLIVMREIYQDIKEGTGTVGDIGKRLKDPFFDVAESHSLVGVASIFLRSLFHNVTFEHYAPIINQEGKVTGKLLLEIARTEGAFPTDRQATCEQDSESTSTHISDDGKTNVTIRIKVKAAVGIPPALSHFLFCQYKFCRDEAYTVVPSISDSRHERTRKANSPDFRFGHERFITLSIDEELVEFCEDGALSVEVYGHKSKGFYSATEAFEQRRKALVLADRYSIAHPDLCWICFDLNMKCHHVRSRWSELVRKLELWVEIQEIDDHGNYTSVEIQERDDVGTGGIYQLRHGQQRRIAVKIQPVHNTGNLPIVCDSIEAVEVGNPVARSKLQRPLDSYQEEDLQSLRGEWAATISVLKAKVDSKIHILDEKEHKTGDDVELGQSLLDQKNCIVEELNNALVPGQASYGIKICHLGMEKFVPLLFLNLKDMDAFGSTTELDEYLPIIGENVVLKKEQGDIFYNLQLLQTIENMIGCIMSWDSSVHNSIYLNRVTQDHERLFLTLRITLRVSDPKPISLVLRKRICFAVYKRHSLVSKFRKTLGYSNMSLLKATGVTYEIVGSTPNTFGSHDIDDDSPEACTDEENSFFDKYTEAVSSVETILYLERLKQQDLLMELIHQDSIAGQPPLLQHGQLSKTLSVPSLASRRLVHHSVYFNMK